MDKSEILTKFPVSTRSFLEKVNFEFTTDYPEAVQIARALGKKIALATPRIHVPGENGILTGILGANLNINFTYHI